MGYKIISSYKTMLILILLYALTLGIATLVESYIDTSAARSYIYHAVWFMFLHLMMVINGIAILKRRNMFQRSKGGILLFHLSFIVILIGATVTHFTSKEGIMQIREGESTTLLFNEKTQKYEELPVRIELLDFVLTRYPGSQSPSSYQSHIAVSYQNKQYKENIGMNRVMNVDGYRFFQTSFHPDEKGTVLTVNYDFPGMQITYLGYLLLLLGFVITPFQSSSRFRWLCKRLGQFGIVLLLLYPNTLHAELPEIDATHADKFGKLLIQNPKGRLEPMASWSAKLIRKIHQKEHYGQQNSNQMLLALFLYPYEWADEPIIQIKNKELLDRLQTTDSYVSYNQLFTSHGQYRLEKEVEQANSVAANKQTKFQKDLLALDERINIIFQLQQGRLMALFPHPSPDRTQWFSAGDDLSCYHGKDSLFVSKVMFLYAEEVEKALDSGNWQGADKVVEMIHTYQKVKNHTIPVDPSRIEAELLYNKLSLFNKLFKLYLLLGGILLVYLFYRLLVRPEFSSRLITIFYTLITIGFIIHTSGIALRWYISGYAPWSNAYETMLFVAWSVILIGLIFGYKTPILTALCTLLGGILLFVSSLNWMNPEITPLVPVLQSYWLMLHVAVIMMGYGFFFVSALIGCCNLMLLVVSTSNNREHIRFTIEKTTIINELSMISGTVFLTLGIFIGAVWANESWGRYWGWDPKETWALITIIVYTFVLHMRFVPRLNSSYLFNLFSMWSILSVLMTYFGVNYYLTGLHSYGSHNGFGTFTPLLIIFTVMISLSLWSYKKRRPK